MVSLDKLAEKLSDFGITFNQARVYIATAKLGIASVSQLAKCSNVPREEVYRILPQLQKLGLIEKTLERPLRVKATAVATVLSILIKREQDITSKKVAKLETEKNKFVMELQNFKMDSECNETPHFTLISQKDAVIEKILSMIEAAEKSIDITISSEQLIHFFANHRSSIIEASKRGVEFRIMLEKFDYDESIAKFIEESKALRLSLHLRFVNKHSNCYFIGDNKIALAATSMEFAALGEKQYLWTDHSSLVRLIEENFQIMWLTSEEIDVLKNEDASKRLNRIFDSFAPTDHLLFIYRSAEDKYNVLCSFLRTGLKHGEAVAYVVSDENLEQIKDTLQKNNIDVERNEKTGAIKILADNEFYVIDRKFCIQTTRSLIEKMYDRALKRGFKGLRIFGEMDCFFHCNLCHELIEYEKETHRIFDLPVIGMCAYNANLIEKANNSVDLYNELLKTHAKILFTGRGKQLGKIEIRQACTI